MNIIAKAVDFTLGCPPSQMELLLLTYMSQALIFVGDFYVLTLSYRIHILECYMVRLILLDGYQKNIYYIISTWGWDVFYNMELCRTLNGS